MFFYIIILMADLMGLGGWSLFDPTKDRKVIFESVGLSKMLGSRSEV